MPFCWFCHEVAHLLLVVYQGQLPPFRVASFDNLEVQNVECETRLSSPFPAVVEDCHRQMEVHPG